MSRLPRSMRLPRSFWRAVGRQILRVLELPHKYHWSCIEVILVVAIVAIYISILLKRVGC